MKNDLKKEIFLTLNNSNIMKFINFKQENNCSLFEDKDFQKVVDNEILAAGCNINRLYSDYYNFLSETSSDNLLSVKSLKIIKAFQNSTSFKSKLFQNYNFIPYECNDKKTLERIRLSERISSFSFLGFECAIKLKTLLEENKKMEIYKLSAEAHGQLVELINLIILDRMTFFQSIIANDNDNIIYNGFLFALFNLSELDRRNFSIEKHLFLCEFLKCSNRIYLADNKNRDTYCSNDCLRIDSNSISQIENNKNI